MTNIEQELHAALVELAEAVKRMATANPKPDLPGLFARIDALGTQLPPGTDPELRHFIQRKSYEKALAWLEGRVPARGACGDRHT